ncbi:four helix bundle protein [Pseudoxanthomonas composti]|uniref:Four helix bundle protein n=1 Tax=Pseudoxanthomonas composti TaxID=2137479 RepID=A0A4Q1JVI2_9GAMM|nr:four helix bundle protein [Pseudoxanthomonas composti]RXR06169.1 four helix bundle protein [Pseudoxanthomonas composti]
MHYSTTTLWNKAMRLAELVCRSVAGLPAEERYGMRLQLTRASVSVASNIAEGWTRESKRERRQFLSMAHGSLSELHTQLILCERVHWLPAAALLEPLRLIDEISRMLTVLRRKARER